jgi:tetratricopeptide (TPR) repeat protein
MVLGKLERRPEAEAAFRRAIADLEGAHVPDKAVGLAVFYDDLSVFLADIVGRRPDSASANQRALEYWERVPADVAARPANRMARAKALNNRYAALYDLGHQSDCEPVYRQAVELLRGLVAEFPRNPEYLHYLGGMVGNHGRVVCDLGDPAQGRRLIEEAIRLEEEAIKLDPRNTDFRWTLHAHYLDLAKRPLWAMKLVPEALDAARKSLALAQQLAAEFPSVPQHKRCVVKSLRLLGAIHANTGRVSEADDYYRQAAAIQDQVLAADPSSTTDRALASDIRVQLAGARYLAGRYVEAVEEYRKGFELNPGIVTNGCQSFAACAAARAGCGVGAGADKVSAAERANFRQLALQWLTAELARLVKDAETANGQQTLRVVFGKWQKDADFAGVRDADGLAKLPDTERVTWQKLWADVAQTLERYPEVPAATKPNEQPPM